MQASQIPVKFQIPWANSAGGSYIRQVPVASQIGVQNGAASLTDGFPPDTFISVAAGGVPPFGQDTNGILNQITAWDRWQNAGGAVSYDATFSTAIGGYPVGAVLFAASGTNWWLSLVDNNASNPDAGGANWQYLGYGQTYAGNPNGNVAGYAPTSINLSGSLLYDTTNKILWLCTTSGTTSTAVWTQMTGGGGSNVEYWCGTSTGTNNAQVLAAPASMQTFPTGAGVKFVAGSTNSGPMTLTVGSFGTFPVRVTSQGGGGPVALLGNEVVQGCVYVGEFDGTYIQLDGGSAAFKTATDHAQPNVASVKGVFNAGHLLAAADTSGTVSDAGGTISGSIPTPTYLNATNAGIVVGAGVYQTDTTTASGGAFLIYLPVAITNGQTFVIADMFGTWGQNNLTINTQGHTFTYGGAVMTGNLVCNTSGAEIKLNYNGSTLEFQ